jgi:hypothetical protein
MSGGAAGRPGEYSVLGDDALEWEAEDEDAAADTESHSAGEESGAGGGGAEGWRTLTQPNWLDHRRGRLLCHPPSQLSM